MPTDNRIQQGLLIASPSERQLIIKSMEGKMYKRMNFKYDVHVKENINSCSRFYTAQNKARLKYSMIYTIIIFSFLFTVLLSTALERKQALATFNYVLILLCAHSLPVWKIRSLTAIFYINPSGHESHRKHGAYLIPGITLLRMACQGRWMRGARTLFLVWDFLQCCNFLRKGSFTFNYIVRT